MITAPIERGYAPLYRRGERNSCPGCGATHWHVGRFSAECGACATAIPFAPVEGAKAKPSYPWWAARP